MTCRPRLAAVVLAVVGLLWLAVPAAAQRIIEMPKRSSTGLTWRLWMPDCQVTIASDGRVTHNCKSLDEATALFWRHVSLVGLERSGQVREALELAAEFVHDPDESMMIAIDAVYRSPDRVGDLEKEIERTKRLKLAAQKIREALALLKEQR
jgi:hypothetical protein